MDIQQALRSALEGRDRSDGHRPRPHDREPADDPPRRRDAAGSKASPRSTSGRWTTTSPTCSTAASATTSNATADVDFAFSFGTDRFRGNAFYQRGLPAVALRLIQNTIPTFAEIGLPPAVQELIKLKQGLILFCGPTGSGKSTSMATLVDAINMNPSVPHPDDRGPDRVPPREPPRGGAPA